MPPVYPAERVARAIVSCARRPRREVFVGNMARLTYQQFKVMPATTERGMALMTDKQHLYQDRPAPPTPGAVHQPLGDGYEVDGGWHGRRKTRTRRLAGAGLATVAGVALLRRRNGG